MAKKILFMMWLGWLSVFGTYHAQETSLINAETGQWLTSVQRYEFLDLVGVTPQAGDFVLSDSGNILAVLARSTDKTNRQSVWVMYDKGTVTLVPLETGLPVVAPFFEQDVLYWIEQDGSQWHLNALEGDKIRPIQTITHSGGIFGGWKREDWVGLEVLTLDQASEIVRVNVKTGEKQVLPYLPANDSEAVVRIGRVPYPYVVTSSETGIVKVWDLDAQTLLYEVDNGTGQPSVFGNINATATHLVWRDNANETLYLLDFLTGKNSPIDALNGDYAQWYFLSIPADLILAAHLGDSPSVIAWDVMSGERTILGNYRTCNRPQPDMARLSVDGSTLAIGCGLGLEVWRVVMPEGR